MQLTSVSTVFGWPWPSIINNVFLPTTIHDTWHHHPTSPPSPRHHRPQQPPSTTYKHGIQPPTAMWQHHVTSHNDHQDQQPQVMKKAQEWMQTTPPLTNDGQHLWTDTGDDEVRWDSLPHPHWFLWQQIQVPCRCQWCGNQTMNDDVVRCHCYTSGYNFYHKNKATAYGSLCISPQSLW